MVEAVYDSHGERIIACFVFCRKDLLSVYDLIQSVHYPSRNPYRMTVGAKSSSLTTRIVSRLSSTNKVIETKRSYPFRLVNHRLYLVSV